MLAGGGNTRKLPGSRSGKCEPAHRLVLLGDQVLHSDVKVRHGLEKHGNVRPETVDAANALGRGRMVPDKVAVKELVHQADVAVV